METTESLVNKINSFSKEKTCLVLDEFIYVSDGKIVVLNEKQLKALDKIGYKTKDNEYKIETIIPLRGIAVISCFDGDYLRSHLISEFPIHILEAILKRLEASEYLDMLKDRGEEFMYTI